jgi:GxxExxY protein
MNANKRELILKDEVYCVVSCSMEIINGLGHGLHEKPYENALVVEFEHRGIPYEQQKAFPVNWRGQRVGQFIPDLIAYNQIAVDTKTIDRITNIESGQMLNYLRVTQLPLGLIINFKQPKLQWERIILSQ